MKSCCAVLVALKDSSPRTERKKRPSVPVTGIGMEKRDPVKPPCMDQRPSLKSETSPVANSAPCGRSIDAVSVRVRAPNVRPLS